MMKNIAAIILAAGKGKRMQTTHMNKVALPIGGKPMIQRSVAFIKSVGIETVIVVVGFAKESVKEVLGTSVIYAEQKEQLGTANAVLVGLTKLPENIQHVLIVNGDDSAFYKRDTIEKLIKKHVQTQGAATFLTTEKEQPMGIGRIVRDQHKQVVKIVEEKDATEAEKNIQEINVGCYLFQVSFLKKYLPVLSKSSITGEYYLTGLIDLGIQQGEKIETVKEENLFWYGINTPEELAKAERMFHDE